MYYREILFVRHPLFGWFVKGRVNHIEIAVIQLVESTSEPFTVLTKSKRCPKALDT